MENLNKLYDLVIEKEELTSENLIDIGLDKIDISYLLMQNTIKKIDINKYIFTDIEKLYDYGIKIAKKKDFIKSEKCFLKCYEMDKTHYNTLFQLFMNYINENKPEEAIKYLTNMLKQGKKYRTKDNNIYLHLIDNLIKLNKEKQNYVDKLKLKDVLIDKNDNRYENIDIFNEIRMQIYNRKYTYAYKRLNDISHQVKLLPPEMLMRVMLYHILEKEAKIEQLVFELIKNKEYEQLYIFLLGYKRFYKSFNSYILDLIEDIIYIKNNNKIPDITIDETDNIFDALKGKNYKLAYILNTSYNLKYNVEPKDSVTLKLLKDICILMDETNEKTKIIKYN